MENVNTCLLLMKRICKKPKTKKKQSFCNFLLQGHLHVTPQRSSSEAFEITWSPLPVQDTSVLALPQFKPTNREWRLYFKQGIVRLHFVQGLEDIAVIAM